MDEIIVAEAERSIVAVAGLVAAAGVLSSVTYADWRVLLILGALGYVAVRRLAQMKLSVTRTSVVVVNYTRTYELPIEEVRIVDEQARDDELGLTRLVPAWLSEDDDEAEKPGRILYLTDHSGRKVQVGLAPVYGSRLDKIAEDLYRAIETMRSGG